MTDDLESPEEWEAQVCAFREWPHIEGGEVQSVYPILDSTAWRFSIVQQRGA
jgi:hypothetical protein